MTAAAHTPGPWRFEDGVVDQVEGGMEICRVSTSDDFPCITETEDQTEAEVRAEVDAECEANARLITAAPTMADAIKGLIGLCQMLRNRDDCPPEIRQALTHNHRIIAGYEALSAAGIHGFQPSDFDAAKAARS